MRLKSRGRTDVGTVEIRTNDGWVEVCDQGWDDVDAKVLCLEMGFKDGLSLCCSELGVDQSDSVSSKGYTNVQCQGNEKKLSLCPCTETRGRCASDRRASAICYDIPRSAVNTSEQ